MSTIKTDELAQFHELGVYKSSRLIDLSGEIDEDNAVKFIKNIRLLDFFNDKDITVLMNTPGGDVQQGMAIVDAIKECNSKVITHAVGPCWSMGAIILQAGDYRKISANATIMVHIGDEGYDSDHPRNIDRWLKENRRLGKVADDILFQKIKEKKPRFKKEAFTKILTFDTIYPADEAIKWGLADEIAEHKGF